MLLKSDAFVSGKYSSEYKFWSALNSNEIANLICALMALNYRMASIFQSFASLHGWGGGGGVLVLSRFLFLGGGRVGGLFPLVVVFGVPYFLPCSPFLLERMVA
jgi:hypothetical protein